MGDIDKMLSRVAIWGAGGFGRYVYDQLKDREDIDVKYFLDKNPDMQGKTIYGVSIAALELLKSDQEIEIDYVLVSFLNGLSIYDQLSEFKKIRFGIVKDKVFGKKIKFKNNLTDDSNIFWIDNSCKPLLKYMETHITDYCNLNCKGCAHFSNLYHAGAVAAFDTYCSDLKQVSQKVNLFGLSLLGGEALLNDRITDYISCARKTLPYADISIITNGLLLPSQKEEFFDCCREEDVAIEVSEYPPTAQMKDRIISTLEEQGINYKIRRSINAFMKNIDLSGKADKYDAMKHCLQDGCNFLRNGKLYKCPFETFGNTFFEHFGFGIRFHGGTDIYDEKLDWDKLVYRLEKEPVDACGYCGKGEWFPWERSDNPAADEWIVDKE